MPRGPVDSPHEMPEDAPETIGEQLVGWGKVALLQTRGRLSGRPVRTPVGFWQDDDGTLFLAAGSREADWALNLRAHAVCSLTIGEVSGTYTADESERDERARVVTGLILKYGTPAERLGHGPVFRLTPRDTG
jgi:deazaflavin-dependent oxidoreductase (nitroreductase family)